jgi:hypothetical protein
MHIVYAFATDGLEATSINTGFGSSPIPGGIAAYLFVVLPPKAQVYLPLVRR